MLDPDLPSTYSDERVRRGVPYKLEMAMLPTLITSQRAGPYFEIVSWQINDAKGDMSSDEFIVIAAAYWRAD